MNIVRANNATEAHSLDRSHELEAGSGRAKKARPAKVPDLRHFIPTKAF
jgi:hypothetical protein